MDSMEHMKYAEKMMAQIKKGAFLTVTAEDQTNTMTIGWATLGFSWTKPVFMVAVRNSRHTYGLLEKAVDFTVSVPSGDMKESLMFCGTKSGRDVDKIKACNLSLRAAEKTLSPILDIPGIHLECAIIVITRMEAELTAPVLQSLYPKEDLHTLYFGEVLSCYER